jgi:hypothetical protein
MAELLRQELRLTWLAKISLLMVNSMFLCLPALINGSPIVFDDTRTYYKSGRTAIDRIDAIFHPSHGAAIEAALRMARGVRSAYYSLFEYIATNIGSLWLVIAIQAVVVALMLRLVFEMLCPKNPVCYNTVVIMSVTIFTTGSWTVSYVMPDIFNSVLALAIIMASLFWEELSRLRRICILLFVGSSFVMHTTNLLTAVGLLIVAALLRWKPWAHLSVLGAVMVGIVALLAVGVVGFKEWSISPQSPPFLMARIIADGPGRIYLQDHCPQIGWAICRHLDRLNGDDEHFLWLEDGVYSASIVSPDERAELRAEDKKLFVAAALEHPWLTIKQMSLNLARQLSTFPLDEYIVPSWATYTSSELTLWLRPYSEPLWQRIWSGVIYAVVFASLGYLMLLNSRGLLTRDQADFFILAMTTAWLAALAGALSDVKPRYEARAIWLIPLAATLVFVSRRPEGAAESTIRSAGFNERIRSRFHCTVASS